MKHREKYLQRNKAYAQKNHEKKQAYYQARYVRNRETILQSRQDYRQQHPEEIKVYRHRHYQNNRDMYRTIRDRRRARLANAPVNDLTDAHWQSIKAHYGFQCAYCGKKPQRLTKDHIIPLSKGGSHTYSNVVPACRSCNSKKRAGPPLKPVQPLLLVG